MPSRTDCNEEGYWYIAAYLDTCSTRDFPAKLEEIRLEAGRRLLKEFSSDAIREQAYTLVLQQANIDLETLLVALSYIITDLFIWTPDYLHAPRSYGEHVSIAPGCRNNILSLFHQVYSVLPVFLHEVFYALCDTYFHSPGITEDMMRRAARFTL